MIIYNIDNIEIDKLDIRYNFYMIFERKPTNLYPLGFNSLLDEFQIIFNYF